MKLNSSVLCKICNDKYINESQSITPTNKTDARAYLLYSIVFYKEKRIQYSSGDYLLYIVARS